MPKEEKEEIIETKSEYGFPTYKPSKLTGKIAKRDHLVVQNQYRFDIKKGDDLSDIPEHFYNTLKTEQVI